MADVRVDRPAYLHPVGVPGASEDRRRQQPDGQQPDAQQRDRREGHAHDAGSGREELAVALDQGGRSLAAHLEAGDGGPEGSEPCVRIVDRATGRTVAVLTPGELRTLAEQTGLPAGLLFQART